MGTISKKLLSIVLIITLLVNSNVSVFGQLVSDQSYKSNIKDIRELITPEVKGKIEGSIHSQIEGMCKGLSLCIMLEGKEKEWGAGSKVNLLYLNKDIIKQLLESDYGKDVEIDEEEWVKALSYEREVLQGYKTKAKALWINNKGQIQGEDLVRYFRGIIPALYIADKTDKGFEDFAKRAYGEYLVNLNKELESEKTISKILEGNKSYKQEELLGLGEVIYGYSIVWDGLPNKTIVDEIAYKSAISELSTIVVPAYITVLLERGNYNRLGNYIKGLGYYDIVHSDGHSSNWFNGMMEMFMPGSYIKLNWGNLSSYAPGPVSKNGYYRTRLGNGKEEIRNIWEDLPSVIASYGVEGEKLINDIFYNGLRLGHEGRFKPHAIWEHGVLIPFILGSIGTNKIKARAHQDIAKGTGTEYAWAKEFGANIVGMVELGLMDYKFYDVPNYEYYKRVREVLTKPYWAEIQAVKNGTESGLKMPRRNFDVQSHTERQVKAGWFVSGIYNDENKTGLILRQSERAWEGGRKILATELKVAGLADVVASVYYTYQLAVSLAGLMQMVKNGVTLLKAAKSLRAIGEKGSLIQIAKGIRKGRYDYLIKKPGVKASTKGKTSEVKVEIPEEVTLVDNKGNRGIYNTKTGKTREVKANKAKASTVQTATVGEGSGAGGGSAESALGKVRAQAEEGVMSAERQAQLDAEVISMEEETQAAQAKPNKAKNIFGKSYNQMNNLEKGLFDLYMRLELGGLGDLKAAVRDSKSLLTTKDGLNVTATTAGTFGLGTSPVTAMNLRPQVVAEVTAGTRSATVFDMPINLFDPSAYLGGASTRGIPNITTIGTIDLGRSSRSITTLSTNNFKPTIFRKIENGINNSLTTIKNALITLANRMSLARIRKEHAKRTESMRVRVIQMDEAEINAIDNIKNMLDPENDKFATGVILIFEDFKKGKISRRKAISKLTKAKTKKGSIPTLIIKPGEKKSIKFIETLFKDQDKRIEFLNNLEQAYRILEALNINTKYFYIRNGKPTFEMSLSREEQENINTFSKLIGDNKISLSAGEWKVGTKLKFYNQAELDSDAKIIYQKIREGILDRDFFGTIVEINKSEYRVTSAEFTKDATQQLKNNGTIFEQKDLRHFHIELQLTNVPFDLNFSIPTEAITNKYKFTIPKHGTHSHFDF